MKILNMNTLAELICKKEGKKKSVDIAQVKEILAILSDLLHSGKYNIISLLFANGHHRWIEMLGKGKPRAKRKIRSKA